MALPDNFNPRAFDRVWADQADWESVLDAGKHALYAAITRAFEEYPVNASLRAIVIRKAYGLFATSLKKYLPLIGDKKQEQIDRCLENMFESIDEGFRAAALQEAGDICFMYENILEGHYNG